MRKGLRRSSLAIVVAVLAGCTTTGGLGSSDTSPGGVGANSGSPIGRALYCGVGVQNSPACRADPQIRVTTPHNAGFWDVPCSGQTSGGEPSGCATRPAIDPALAVQAKPLRIPSVNVPVGAAGAHEVVLGEASLPNGVLSEATMTLANDLPTDFSLTEDGLRLVIRSTDPSRPPFINIYTRGRIAGLETVQAVLEYTVVTSAAGSVLQVRNVVVH
jgi:hypothetical protein